MAWTKMMAEKPKELSLTLKYMSKTEGFGCDHTYAQYISYDNILTLKCNKCKHIIRSVIE